MKGIVDIHSHILPGLDDGAHGIDDTVEMARMAVSSGVSIMAATPHSVIIEQEPRLAFAVLETLGFVKQVLKNEGIPLKLVAGMELFARDDIVELLDEGLLLPLGNTKNVLVEFDFDDDTEYMSYIFYELTSAGYTPVAAHPERYFNVIRDPRAVDEWLQMGCRIQINKGSILGRFGNEVKHTARLLLGRGQVFTVASDAHSPAMRTPHMGEVVEELVRLTDENTAEKLLCTNPRSLLEAKGEYEN